MATGSIYTDLDLHGNKLLNVAGLTDGSGNPLSSGGSAVPDPAYTLNGIVAENFTVDNVTNNTSTASTSGLTRGFLITPYVTADANHIGFEVATPGSGLTANTGSVINNGLVLCDLNSDVLAWADTTSLYGSSGLKLADLNVTVSLVAGTKYILYQVCTGSTPVALRGGGGNISGLLAYNIGLSAAPYRFMYKTTSLPKTGNVSLSGWTAGNGLRPWFSVCV